MMRGVLVLLVAFASGNAFAETHAQPAPAAAPAAPATAPATSVEAKAAPCGACHGPNGNSLSPIWPKLAGQSAAYLYKELVKFKNGERSDPVMSAQAASLSEQDMKDLAAHFAKQKQTGGAASPELASAGDALYRRGNPESGVPACIGCHGPKGLGNAAAGYPRVGGQQSGYVEGQLQKFRGGTRKGPMMSVVAQRLTDEEIRAVASYLAGLH
jgi:cytochrome c553